MRSTSLIFIGCLMACSDGHAHSDVVLVNMASDEVFQSMTDLEAQGLITPDNSEAAALTSPQNGASVPAAEKPTFSWALPTAGAPTPRHGTTTGTFYWLKFTGEGLTAGKLDVLVANATTWTPEDHDWEAIATATGQVTVRLVTAVFADAVLAEGPWRYDPDAFIVIQH